jgi:hypothetical protein
VHKRIISAVKKVKFVSDGMSYIILRSRWCHIIVLNVHAPTEDNTDDMKGSFYEELERLNWSGSGEGQVESSCECGNSLRVP